jgi:hypothetical protein
MRLHSIPCFMDLQIQYNKLILNSETWDKCCSSYFDYLMKESIGCSSCINNFMTTVHEIILRGLEYLLRYAIYFEVDHELTLTHFSLQFIQWMPNHLVRPMDNTQVIEFDLR